MNPLLFAARSSGGGVVSVRYSVSNGSKRTPAGSAARMRSRYAAAMATVVTGGFRFGMMIARANCRTLNGRTLASWAPSRTCRCQSSGRRIRNLVMLLSREKSRPLPALRRKGLGLFRPENKFAAAQQLYRVSHAKAGDIGRHVAEAAVAVAGRQVDVDPGHLRRDEAVQEARGENVIALAVRRALQDIGDGRFQVAVVVLVHRKRPHALAAAITRRADGFVPVRSVRERAAVPFGQRVDARARECREIDDQLGPLACGDRERVSQHHAALGIAVR